MSLTPVDVVDRNPRQPNHGISWTRTVDALLDELSRLHTEHDNATQELLALAKNHQGIEDDEHFQLALMALL